MLKAAIIGCGAIAQVHKKVLLSLPEAELIACCDTKPERAEAFASDCGIRAYADATTMLNQEHPDVAHLCVPHPLHTPLAQLCAGMGIHVFTEKPPAVSRTQWAQFAQLEKNGCRVGICFQNRYNRAVRSAKALLSSGGTGAVLGARAFLTWHREAAYYTESGWRGTWQTEGGGVLLNQAIHTLDLLVTLLGSPASAETNMSNHSLRGIIEVEDTMEADICFRSGIHALFYATNAYCCNAPVLLEIVCEKASLRLEGDSLTVSWADGRVERDVRTGAAPLGKDYWGSSHYACIQDFYRSILENRPFQNDIPSVRDTMRLLLMMYDPYRGKTIGNSTVTKTTSAAGLDGKTAPGSANQPKGDIVK